VAGLNLGPELSLFPLHTVLFPGGILPLRIFESRYLDMVGRCLKSAQGFGVVAIRDGSEVGVADSFAIGTVAEIIDWQREEDGLLGILAVGRRRFEVASRARRPDGLYLGQVTWLDDSPVALPARHRGLAEVLKTALANAGKEQLRGPSDFNDAVWVAYRLAEILPIELGAKQALLSVHDPVARLDELGAMLENLVIDGQREE